MRQDDDNPENQETMKYVTIKDIAKHLLVSVSSVSRALNNDPNIRKETREKIVAAAREMGYVPNPNATSLQSGRSRSIGVLVPEMTTPYAANVIDGIQDVCFRNNYKVLIASSGEDAEKELRNIEYMQQFMIDGFIACRCNYHKNTEVYQRLVDKGIPLVFFDRRAYDIEAPEVMIDDETKSFFLVEHLINIGRRRIAYIGADNGRVYNAVLREAGYREALEKHGIQYDPALVLTTEGLAYSDGAAAVDQLLKLNVDAIAAFTDTLAIGAMNRLKAYGKRVPQDVAVTGFSGTALSTIVSPQLTTVETSLFEMGQETARIVIDHITGKSHKTEKVVLEADIVYRGSTEA